MTLILILFAAFVVFSFIHFAARSKRPFLRALFSVMLGLLSLSAVNLLSPLTSVYIPVTTLSTAVSAFGGIPGTALLVMISMI